MEESIPVRGWCLNHGDQNDHDIYTILGLFPLTRSLSLSHSLLLHCQIYTCACTSSTLQLDIDNAPGPKFLNGTVITDDDDSWFVVEQLGIMSQYFMAASPRHPFIHIALIQLFERLLQVDNIQKQYVPFVTGPGTIKSAMMIFRNDKVKEKVQRGKYYGWDGRSITVEGARGQSNDYVIRESVNGIHKKGGYTAMGMKHFSDSRIAAPTDSCYEHLYQQTKKMVKTTNHTIPSAALW